MRKVVIWTGAAAAIASAALGWVVQAALSKAAAFVYAIVVSVIANAVFDYVKAPHPAEAQLTPGGGAVATAIVAIKPHLDADDPAPKFSLPVSMPASLPPPAPGVPQAAPAAIDAAAAPAGTPPAVTEAPGAPPAVAAEPGPSVIDLGSTAQAAALPAAAAPSEGGGSPPAPTPAVEQSVRTPPGPGPGSGGLY